MKVSNPNQSCRGLTRLEVVVILLLVLILVMVLLPALVAARMKKQKIDCTNNLMQIGISFRTWETDHDDKYPMGTSVTNGGAMEEIVRGNPTAVFQVMSNILYTPFILHCPADKFRRPATDFNALASTNISYFINIDINESNPQDIMTGDDNFEIHGVPVKPGLLEISSNTPIAWSAARHKFSANISMADGSVQGMNNSMLTSWLRSTNFNTTRLAIP